MTKNNLKTYQLSLLQAKSYRLLRAYVTEFLKDYELTPMEWTLLGYVSEENNDGIRISELAELFSVEISFMTNTLNKLHTRKLVTRTTDKNDQRARLVQITRQGSMLIDKVEPQLATSLSTWFSGLHPQIINNYIEAMKYMSNKH